MAGPGSRALEGPPRLGTAPEACAWRRSLRPWGTSLPDAAAAAVAAAEDTDSAAVSAMAGRGVTVPRALEGPPRLRPLRLQPPRVSVQAGASACGACSPSVVMSSAGVVEAQVLEALHQLDLDGSLLASRLPPMWMGKTSAPR